MIDRLVADAKLRLHEFGGAHVLSILGAALSSPHCISLSRKVPSLGSFTFAVVDRIAPKATESATESSTSAEKSSSTNKKVAKVTPVTKILAANPRLAVRAISALAAAEASGTHVMNPEDGEKYQEICKKLVAICIKNSRAGSLDLKEKVQFLTAVSKVENTATLDELAPLCMEVMHLLAMDAPLLELDALSHVLNALPSLPDRVKCDSVVEDLALVCMKAFIRRRRNFPPKITGHLAEGLGRLSMIQCQHQHAFFRENYRNVAPLLTWKERTLVAAAIPNFEMSKIQSFLPEHKKVDMTFLLQTCPAPIAAEEVANPSANEGHAPIRKKDGRTIGEVWEESASAARAVRFFIENSKET